MSASSFSTRTRNAGNLESENKIFASFRSLNKFDEQALPRSKHDQLFKDENILIEPLKDMPPQPPKQNENIDEEKREKKKSKTKRRTKKDDSHESSRGSRKKNENENKNEDDEIIESLKRITDKHRQRRQNMNADNQSFTSDLPKDDKEEKENHKQSINSSFRSLRKSNSAAKLKSNDDEVTGLTKQRRSNSIVKTNAFESPKQESESDGEADAKVDIDKQKPKEDLPKNSSNSSMSHTLYFKSIRESDTLDFILTPAPQGQIINCKIICKKGIFNEYYFYIENLSNTDLLIMKAHRKVASTKSYYTIDTINYDKYGNANSTEVNCARILSNISRKKFKLDLSSNFVQYNNNEILNIAYKSNVGEPRKILASASLCSGTKNSSQDRVTYFLKNRQPVFDMHRKKFVLNYNGRARMSSKNNFQIIEESSPDDILMQLGKIETTVYNCDYAFPLCALQAYGFALASLCR